LTIQNDPKKINWKIHLSSTPEKVYHFLSTDVGRSKFWANTTEDELGETVTFVFPNGYHWNGKILEAKPNSIFSIKYIDNTTTTFRLVDDGKGGTDLELEDSGVNPSYITEVMAGWGSVLMALKAAVDFGVDLRNHDPERTWDQGYFDN
jgi:uncharacterized protein YndB with AHSA1/START domain